MSKKQKTQSDWSWLFAKKSLPPRPRARPPFQPWKINAKLFLVDKIRPFPEWPLICRKENRMSFSSESECKKYLSKFMMDGQIYRMWVCGFCRMTHHECYPSEATGLSSGKSIRKGTFLASRKASEEVEASDE